MMMGMVLVACFAARLVTKFSLTRASTLGCTSLPTGLAPSPSSPRGRETQPEYFAFNITKLPWPCRNASIRVPGVLGSPQPEANPILGTFFVCCASAGSIPAKTKPNQHKNSFHAPIFTAVRDALSRKFGPERQILDQKRSDTFKKL